MAVHRYFVVNNKNEAGGVGFSNGHTGGFGFIQVFQDALDLPGFIVGYFEVAALKGLLEEGSLESI